MTTTTELPAVRAARLVENLGRDFDQFQEAEQRIALARAWKSAQARLDGWRDIVRAHEVKLEREVADAVRAFERFELEAEAKRAARAKNQAGRAQP